jgi:hypothetical protein
MIKKGNLQQQIANKIVIPTIRVKLIELFRKIKTMFVLEKSDLMFYLVLIQ